jgi:ribosomal protein S27E
MSDEVAELSFDRAVYEHAQTAAPCAECQQALGAEYWTWQGRVLCADCRARTDQVFEAARSTTSLGKAALWGGLTALGCGIAYAIFVAVSDMQLALATIGIGILIAKVVRKASHGIGGRRYQVLALCLTYAASAMAYAPAVWHGITSADRADSAEASKDSAQAATPGKAEPHEPDMGVGGFALGVAFLFGLTLAAPFLAMTEAPLGFLIVLFGLWEAWKLSGAIPTEMEGPFRVAGAAPGIPTT